MGFFSRIKKLWGSETETQPQASAPPQAPEAPERPKAAPPHEGAPTPPEPPRREAQTPEPTQAVPADEATRDAKPAKPTEPQQPAEPARKEGGWRRLFGFGGEETTETAPVPTEPAVLFQEKPTAKAALEPWQQALVQALGEAEPKLSTWMTHILDGVTKRGDALWGRLRFLFAQLDVPTAEAEDFIARFDTWLSDMDYDHVDEFRSELQYRMALALELEDEEDERNRLFLKLSAGLGKTREQLTMRIDRLLSMAGGYDDAFWEELEEILLMADVGVSATQELLKRLRPKVRQAGGRDAADFKALLKEELAAVFLEPKAPTVPQAPEVVLMIGVNGAGKTTTIAKLAHRAQMQGRKVLVAAGDTFRAAAIEQLQVWSKRVGAGFYAKTHGSDPAAVAFEAVDYAMKEGYDLVFVDTAGRLQTKHNLMEELKKINRVLGKKLDGAPHRTVLVLDATTGQNALSQVKLFSQASPVDEVILTKLDGTAKGGIIVAIALEFKIPISFVGLGEKMEDLRPFSGQEFASALFD
ncbi:signal recognition particle-docking protein FtsY [Desulfomicrobium escambiense]|uniref:signal recognition particle-docking protein FtsY n=1 Tax=Desulfomicrobium escambiense TaxID=29503 RepID=UPI0004055B67|nr:signal recognition particle-docking protein FtsY [Desulfomicrobium escambiense]